MNKKIKILYTIPNFITAGSGRVLANIAERLDKNKFEPWVCVSRKGGKIEEELEAHGIKVVESPFTVKAKPYLKLFTKAQNAAKPFKPYSFDIWHSFHYADDYTEPIIARLAGARAWVYTKKNMMWGTRAWILRSLLATKVVADNKDMPSLFFDKYGLAKKTIVIQHGIPLEEFSPSDDTTSSLKVELGLPEDAFLIGCVAHLVPVKGHPTLIDAVADIENAHLLLAGKQMDKEYFNRLVDQVNSLGLADRVHFLGFVENIPEFFSQVGVNVLPTQNRGRKEAFGVALIEAMACGIACIASYLSGPQQIIEDGISGLLVPPEDSEALSNAIKMLMENDKLRNQIGAAGRRRVEENFSIEREVAAHERLYLEIMNK